MKDETFMDWMRRNYPRMVKRAQRYAMLIGGMGFALGFYMGLFLPAFVRALPDIAHQLTTETVPLYGVYCLSLVFAFIGFRMARMKQRRK
jgi:hypothetical protein